MSFYNSIIRLLPKSVSNYIEHVLVSDINRHLIWGAFWSVSSTIISKLLVLISTIIIARILDQTAYGELAILRSNANLFVSYTSLGIALTATKYIAQFKIKDKLKTAKIISLVETVNIVAVVFSTIILFILTNKLAISVLRVPHLTSEIKISSLIIIFTTLTSLQVGILSGFQEFKEIGKNILISGIAGFLLQIFLTYFWGLGGAVLGISMNLIFFWIANFISIRKKTIDKYPRFLFSKDLLSEIPILWKFSLPTFLIAIFMETTRWFCNTTMIAGRNGLNEMAIFDVSYQWLVAISFIPAILSQVALPILSNSIDDKERYSAIFYKNFKINVVISILICVVFLLFTSTILSLYGQAYTQSNDVFVYLIICSTLTAINSSIWQITTSSDQMWINMSLNLLWCVVLILATVLFASCRVINANNLAISYLIAYTLQTIALFCYFFFYQKNVILTFNLHKKNCSLNK